MINKFKAEISAFFAEKDKTRFSRSRQIEFLQYFSTWLSAGSSPVKACQAIIDSSDNSYTEIEAEVATEISKSLKNGGSISEGMTRFFDSEIIMLFEVGTKSDGAALSQILNDYLATDAEIVKVKKSLLSGLVYPALIFGVIVVATTLLGSTVLPGIGKVLPGGLPMSANIIIGTANFIVSFWFIVVAVVAALALAVSVALRNAKGSFRETLNRVFPVPFAIHAAIKGMKFLKIFGILLQHYAQSRVVLDSIHALETPFMKSHIETIKQRMLGKGQKLQHALNIPLFSKQTINRLSLALQVEDQTFNQRAVIFVADQTAADVIRSLASVRLWSKVTAWGIVVVAGTMLLAGIVSAFSAISSLAG